MPEGGVVTITACNKTITDEDKIVLPPGEYVSITVADQGIGIRKEHLSRIFDPYFSTKQKGHGLGLASAYSIVKNHGGLLFVQSSLGQGSSFTFFLPAAKQKGEEAREGKIELRHGGGKVLLMDDEPDIRAIAVEVLSYLGYETEEASDGREAVTKYERANMGGSPFDVVILDLTVPGGMGGMDAMQKLLEIDPGVKAIVSSGFVNKKRIGNG